jgi:formylmethanofuran dehydrogenase subunit E
MSVSADDELKYCDLCQHEMPDTVQCENCGERACRSHEEVTEMFDGEWLCSECASEEYDNTVELDHRQKWADA